MSEPSDRELDALVAEKVMGLVRCTAHEGAIVYCHAQPDSPDKGGETRSYSTDISAAMEVVEKVRGRLAKQGFPLIVMETPLDSCNWRVRFGVGFNEGPSKGVIAEADTLSRAICLAALKACEVYTEMVEKI